MTEKEIQNLVSKFLNGTASKEEETKLHEWYDACGFDDEEITIFTRGENKDEVKDRLFTVISTKLNEEQSDRSSFNDLWRKRLPYAAAILVFLLSGMYFLLTKDSSEETFHYTQLFGNDIGPGGENAILELANGKKINLDSTNIGENLHADGIWLTKTDDGALSIDIMSIPEDALQQNTVRTPKGGHFHLKLPDGTRVWLNTASSITFPSSFSEKGRDVYLEGEAYFEVAKTKDSQNRQIPFVVRTQKQLITVLGTSFNVNSYPGESIEYTTLSEGLVRVSPIDSKQSKILQPGEQSLVQNNKITTRVTDLESVMAWKNGDFIFYQETLYAIMKKIERWYDVEVVFADDVDKNRTFSGAVSRSRNLSDVLQLMKTTGHVTFEIEGRRVLVMK